MICAPPPPSPSPASSSFFLSPLLLVFNVISRRPRFTVATSKVIIYHLPSFPKFLKLPSFPFSFSTSTSVSSILSSKPSTISSPLLLTRKHHYYQPHLSLHSSFISVNRCFSTMAASLQPSVHKHKVTVVGSGNW